MYRIKMNELVSIKLYDKEKAEELTSYLRQLFPNIKIRVVRDGEENIWVSMDLKRMIIMFIEQEEVQVHVEEVHQVQVV